ncbi:hypothetical protein [Streptomyces graminilatus]|uniref:hypothetical protein n=1 Tax=Streptomyces graminilatus TaxID=1464070 RepID=UPI000AC5D866|nr:hypothetical protein [Streptomyces graminilatus]
MSRGAWRRAVIVWVVAVAAGGGATVWLRDSARPPETPGWSRTDDRDPARLPRGHGPDPCATKTPEEPTPDAAGGPAVVCIYATAR